MGSSSPDWDPVLRWVADSLNAGQPPGAVVEDLVRAGHSREAATAAVEAVRGAVAPPATPARSSSTWTAGAVIGLAVVVGVVVLVVTVLVLILAWYLIYGRPAPAPAPYQDSEQQQGQWEQEEVQPQEGDVPGRPPVTREGAVVLRGDSSEASRLLASQHGRQCTDTGRRRATVSQAEPVRREEGASSGLCPDLRSRHHGAVGDSLKPWRWIAEAEGRMSGRWSASCRSTCG